MHCPYCQAEETKVIDSRLFSDGHQVRRRRACIECDERFTTYETSELIMPKVIKRDGRRKPFDEEKLRAGVLRALEKRPIADEDIEAMIDSIKHQLLGCGEREVHSQKIGEWVMNALQKLDQIAYVRFASVYCRFQHVNDFKDQVSRLQEEEGVAN